jgi:FixJ family two-component response regulator
MRPALQRLIIAFDFDCDAFASAEALLVRGPQVADVCVVSDFNLPAMSGLDLLATMRKQGGWPPLILITGHDAPGLGEEARRRGAAAYLCKPFSAAALMQAMDEATRVDATPAE